MPPAPQTKARRPEGSRFSAGEALALVREHGVVLVSAKGKGPNLVEAIAGEPIRGSWWGHPAGKRIFSVLNTVTESEEVLVCRLIDGKITLVHRRLWPALVRLGRRVPARTDRASAGRTHGVGRHVSRSVAFPDWVPPAVAQEAEALGEKEARALLAEWLPPGATRAGSASEAFGDDAVVGTARCRRLHSCRRPDARWYLARLCRHSSGGAP